MRLNRTILTGLAVIAVMPVQALDINLTPGEFGNQLKVLGASRDTRLTLSGSADVRDLAQLKKIPEQFLSVDMSGLRIVGYTYEHGNYMGVASYAADELPPLVLSGTKVTELILPATMTSMGNQALALTRLRSVTVPAGVNKIGDYAFSGSKDIQTVKIQGAPAYGKGVFRNCTSLKNVETEAIRTVTDEMFYGCIGITAMPYGVTKVGASGFYGTGIEKLNLSGISEAGDYAFAMMPGLEEITFGTGKIKLGKGAFYGNMSLENIPDISDDISEGLFLGAVPVLSGYITSPVVGEAAFANNAGITNLQFGSGVTEIRADAFRNCVNIKQVDVTELTAVPELSPDAFAGLENSEGRYDIPLYCAADMKSAWTAHPVWSLFNVEDGGASTGMMPVEMSVKAWRNGGTVTVESALMLENVRIYGINGMTYYDGGSGETSLSVEIPEGEILLVRIQTSEGVKLVKLR